jgi:hypothetical protein
MYRNKSNQDCEAVQVIKQMNTLSSEVLNKAIEIYHFLEDRPVMSKGKPGSTVVKQGRRNRRIFTCVYMAFNECGYPADQHYVANLCGLSCNDIDRAFNEAPCSIEVDPNLLIRFYIEGLNHIAQKQDLKMQFDVDETVSQIRDIYKNCMLTKTGKDTLTNYPVKSVSVGLVYYYLQIQDHTKIFEKHLLDHWHLSLACIKKYGAVINEIYLMDRDNDKNYKFWFNPTSSVVY